MHSTGQLSVKWNTRFKGNGLIHILWVAAVLAIGRPASGAPTWVVTETLTGVTGMLRLPPTQCGASRHRQTTANHLLIMVPTIRYAFVLFFLASFFFTPRVAMFVPFAEVARANRIGYSFFCYPVEVAVPLNKIVASR